MQSSLLGFLLIKLPELVTEVCPFLLVILLLILLGMTTAHGRSAGFHLAASPPPPVALAYPTMGRPKLCALPTQNLVSITKPCCVDQGWGAAHVSRPKHPFQHLLHLLMAMKARLARSDQSDTKAYVLGGKHCPLPLHTTAAGLLHRLWEAVQCQSLASICPDLRGTALYFAQQPKFKGREKHGCAPSFVTRGLTNPLFNFLPFTDKCFRDLAIE